ncbi:hypothetical protein WA026_020743 [Henosepilachna vigintioctopunctata]|uniref:G-protein coupled receptors family 2 profile 2 domain-containing protein n=1 Tax=Henosepilachna vigintioctopunctata TaxID=420089 RepID=A0AAW1UB08_9CUCU
MKWAKSTLVLVPLFGVNYILFLGLKFIKNEVVELIWIVCDSVFGSFQGFFVAVLYCFLNSEVKAELKLYFYRIIPFFAANRFIIMCCPCREKFLRSTKARISVSTTLSCSSLYTNGIGHIRNIYGNVQSLSRRCQAISRRIQFYVTSAVLKLSRKNVNNTYQSRFEESVSGVNSL